SSNSADGSATEPSSRQQISNTNGLSGTILTSTVIGSSNSAAGSATEASCKPNGSGEHPALTSFVLLKRAKKPAIPMD
ncbi:unnamed protein product, partial [Didymodactylos carnosus]